MKKFKEEDFRYQQKRKEEEEAKKQVVLMKEQIQLKKKEIVNEIKALRNDFHRSTVDNTLNKSID